MGGGVSVMFLLTLIKLFWKISCTRSVALIVRGVWKYKNYVRGSSFTFDMRNDKKNLNFLYEKHSNFPKNKMSLKINDSN